MSIAHVFLFVKHLIFIDESRVHNMSTSTQMCLMFTRVKWMRNGCFELPIERQGHIPEATDDNEFTADLLSLLEMKEFDDSPYFIKY